MKKLSNSGTVRHINLRLFLLALICAFFVTAGYGQKKDSATSNRVPHPNVVKLSLTSWLLYANSLHMAYERVIGKHQSISIFGGYNEFPVNLKLNLSGTSLKGESSKSGYLIGAQYRFYLPMENKYDAPHGVYLAPYASYYHFNSNRSISHTDSAGNTSTAGLTTDIGLFNIGGMLGYQFVVFKRFVIDAELLGPSYTFYSFKASIKGQLNGIDPDGTAAAIIEALKEKFPLLNDLGSGKEISGSGSGSAQSKFSFVGFRYSVSIGFMF